MCQAIRNTCVENEEVSKVLLAQSIVATKIDNTVAIVNSTMASPAVRLVPSDLHFAPLTLVYR